MGQLETRNAQLASELSKLAHAIIKRFIRGTTYNEFYQDVHQEQMCAGWEWCMKHDYITPSALDPDQYKDLGREMAKIAMRFARAEQDAVGVDIDLILDDNGLFVELQDMEGNHIRATEQPVMNTNPWSESFLVDNVRLDSLVGTETDSERKVARALYKADGITEATAEALQVSPQYVRRIRQTLRERSPEKCKNRKDFRSGTETP